LADSPQPLRAHINPVLGTFLLLLALNLLNYVDRYILPGEISLIQREFHSTDQQMGALTTALFITYMLVAPLTGWLGDRFPRKPLIIAGAVLWSVATLAPRGSTTTQPLYSSRAGRRWRGYLRHFCPCSARRFLSRARAQSHFVDFLHRHTVGAALGYLAGGQMARCGDGVRRS